MLELEWGMHFPGSWFTELHHDLKVVHEDSKLKAVSQDSSLFRDYRTKACPLLPSTAAWWAILETQGWN